MDKCIICGKTLKLYKRTNVSTEQLSLFAYASRKIPEYMHWSLYECKDCHALYSECPTEENHLFSLYEEASYDSSEEAIYASNTYVGYLNRILPCFPREKVLDIGTGNGSYLKFLKDMGVHETVGVEPSKAPLVYADPSVKAGIINAPFRDGMFDAGEFDMVSLFQTVEHIPNPVETLNEIHRIIAPKGYFYLICHDYRSVINRVLGFHSPIYDIEHLQLFSKKSILRLAKKTGFHDIKVFTIRNKYPLRYWVRLFPLPNRMKKNLLSFLETNRIGKMMISINVGNIGLIAAK